GGEEDRHRDQHRVAGENLGAQPQHRVRTVLGAIEALEHRAEYGHARSYWLDQKRKHADADEGANGGRRVRPLVREDLGEHERGEEDGEEVDLPRVVDLDPPGQQAGEICNRGQCRDLGGLVYPEADAIHGPGPSPALTVFPPSVPAVLCPDGTSLLWEDADGFAAVP